MSWTPHAIVAGIVLFDNVSRKPTSSRTGSFRYCL